MWFCFSSRRRHTRYWRDWSSDVCSSDLEAKLKQYELGETFIAAVEAEGGPELLARVWEGPDRLPTMSELRHPQAWLARMGVRRGAARAEREILGVPGSLKKKIQQGPVTY